MKLVVFGLSIGSSWGNGHATLWRGLAAGLSRIGHRVVFFERDVPYYSQHRDFTGIPGGELALYGSWPDALPAAERHLSYTGGPALAELKSRLGAKRVEPLYGSVDTALHRPAASRSDYRCDISCLGAYSEDRQAALDTFFLEPARRLPDRHFPIGGSQYPEDFPWGTNISFIPHVPPAEHPAFYCSSNLTLSVTRGPMAEMGWCPSGRLFQASACGVPVLTDEWEGLDRCFEPDREVLVARTTGHVMDALAMPRELGARIGRAGRERTLSSHTAAHRALELEIILDAALSGDAPDGGLTCGA